MGIMQIQNSRFMRATAAITLLSILAGCLPANVKSGDAKQALSSTQSAGNSVLGSLNGFSGMLASASNTVGISVPGIKKGSELREWTAEDQEGAERAKAVFEGKSPDNLPVYDPTQPGEAARFKAQISELAAKYKGRTTLTPAEMLEVSKVVVPVARFIAQSRTYRENKKSPVKIVKQANGNAHVVIPAGMTVEMALLTYCNDHGLPAPFKGEKMHMRSSKAYMPDSLYPVYKGLHTYAAEHPAAHYQMQGLVWWLRDSKCNFDSLTTQQKQMLDLATPGGLKIVQSYCMQEKVKAQIASQAKGFLPAGASSALTQYQSYMAQANSISEKANAFLNADLTDPVQALQLAQTAGLTQKMGKNSLLDNPYLRQAAPLLKNSNMLKALTPSSTEDKAVSASLAAMEQLGNELGAKAGDDRGSIANYSDLGNGLYAQTQHNGGASSSAVKVVNTTNQDQVLDGSDFVLTSVDDQMYGRTEYHGTQRLSIGPIAPVKAYPRANADKIYTQANEKSAIEALGPLKDELFTVDPGTPAASDKKADCISNGDIAWGDMGLNVLRDVVQAIPVVSTVVYGYSAVTGYDWSTGKKLSTGERSLAFLSAALPFASAAGTALTALKYGQLIGNALRTGYRAYDTAGKITNGAGSVAAGTNAYYQYKAGDVCSAFQSIASSIANGACAMNRTSTAQCLKISGTLSAVGSAGIPANMETVDFDATPTVAGAIKESGRLLNSGMDTVKGFFN